MSVKKTIVRNVLSNWIGYAIATVVSFFVAPYVVHTLGATGYGVWVLVGSLTGYLGLLDFGLRPAIVKFVSRYHALNDHQRMNEVINTVLVVFTLVGLVVALAAVGLAAFAHTVFNVPVEYHAELQLVIILVGLNVALSFPFGVFNASLNAMQRFDVSNVIQTAVYLTRALLTVVFLKLGGGLVALGVISLGAAFLEFALKAVWCRRVIPTLTINLRLVNRGMLKELTAFSAFTFLIAVSFQISFSTGSMVIGALLSAGAITFFAIGANLIEYLKALINYVTVTLTPVASTFDAQRNIEGLRRLLTTGTKYVMLIILPIGGTFMIMGETFITLWMGKEYGPDASRVLQILMISYFVYLPHGLSSNVLYGMGKVKTLAFVTMGSAVINLVLSIMLARRLGIFGVALGTTIPQVIYGAVFMPAYICRQVGVPLATYVRKSFLRPLIAAVPYLLLIWVFERYVPVNSLVTFFLLIAAAVTVYAASAFMFGLDEDHRQAVRQVIRARFARRALKAGR